MTALSLVVRIDRKHADLPAFVVLPAAKVSAWKLTGTTTIEGTLDGAPLGRRSLKRWDEQRWFIELPRTLLAAVGKAPGDRASIVIRRAGTALPAELRKLIDSEAAARKRWESCTAAQQRMLREDVLAAKSKAARELRARRALLPKAPAPQPRIQGLDALSHPIRLRIIGTDLPGRTCGSYSEVVVGLVTKAGCEPEGGIPADAAEARWETAIEVREQAGTPVFRGPAVNGPARERFIYLTWIGSQGAAAPAMFRRAKLRLDAVPAGVLSESLRSGQLVGRVRLTAADGTPACGSLRPPAIVWANS